MTAMPDAMSLSSRDEALNYLRMLDRAGFLVLPLGPPIEASASAAVVEMASATASIAPPTPAGAAASEAAPSDDSKIQALRQVAAEVAQCRKCGLCASRTRTVPGEGNPETKIVFVGEAPGYHEDRQGRPFVGPAGDLLTKMIEAMHFRRDDVFICNVIKCRPPENRDPLPGEVQACESYLLRQLDIIQPKLIVALGRVAVQCLLGAKVSITRVRGEWREYHGIPLMPTFHPAYLLRSPGEKRKCWEDLQKVMAEYERLVGALPR
ncbi:MAG: uracil-DNA glycosylase [Candidatus Sumerlaeota bacterium]|nr:uracil-DNA glycosylase [Candidatus Sumerlaeota bacterium]